MKTYSSANVNVGDEPEDAPVIQDFRGASVIKFSSEFSVWYHVGRNRVAGLRALRDAINTHLDQISPDGID